MAIDNGELVRRWLIFMRTKQYRIKRTLLDFSIQLAEVVKREILSTES